MIPPMRPPRDPGLQHERTALSWQRTALGVVLGGIVLAMTGLRAHATIVTVGSGLMVLAAVAGAVSVGRLRSGRHAALFITPLVFLVMGLGLLGGLWAIARMLS